MQFVEGSRLSTVTFFIVILVALSWSSPSWAGLWEDGYGLGFNDGKASCPSLPACPVVADRYQDGFNDGKSSCPSLPVCPVVTDRYQDGFNDGKSSCPSLPTCPVVTDRYQEGFQEGFNGGKSSCPSLPVCPVVTDRYQEGFNNGKASVPPCSIVADRYQEGFNDGKASVAVGTPTKTYENGYQEGKITCQAAPESCGITVMDEQTVREACKANPASCGIAVGRDEQAIKHACQANPTSCGIEESTFGADLTLYIPSVKSGNDVFQPVTMTYLVDGLIVNRQGKHIFQIDSLNGIELSNQDAHGTLQLFGNVPVAVTQNGQTLHCEKLCKIRLKSKIKIIADLDKIPAGNTLIFDGDCKGVGDDVCELTIDQAHHVVVAFATTMTTRYLEINKKGTGEVKVFVNDHVDKTCSSKESTCIYSYSENTNIVVQAVASKQPAPFESVLALGTVLCPDGSTDECRKIVMSSSKKTVTVSF